MSETDATGRVSPGFTRPLDNRAGLSHVQYRFGTYAHLRDALLRELNRDALLHAWTHRGADDPGIALLEGAAILGDILAFYQELYANEAFLRTAQWRESIADLVALLGYRLRPGTGGKAAFALEIKSDKPVLVPKGFAIKAELERADKPVDFETSADLMAYPWLSKFHLHRPLYTPPIDNGTNEFYVGLPDPAVDPLDLKEGDRLLVGDWDAGANRVDHPEMVVVKSIRRLGPWTLYAIAGGLTQREGPRPAFAACKLGRTFRHFGHNAPPQHTIVVGESVCTPPQPEADDTVIPNDVWTVRGQVTDPANNAVAGATVRLRDEQGRFADKLPATKTDAQGRFTLTYRRQDIREVVKADPDLFLEVADEVGQPRYSSTEGLKFRAGQVEDRDIRMTAKAPPRKPRKEKKQDEGCRPTQPPKERP